jgi:hypothetical protein
MRFQLAALTITLQHNPQQAIELYNQQFAAQISLFESKVKQRFDLCITNKAFGIDVV